MNLPQNFSSSGDDPVDNINVAPVRRHEWEVNAFLNFSLFMCCATFAKSLLNAGISSRDPTEFPKKNERNSEIESNAKLTSPSSLKKKHKKPHWL